MKAMSLQKDSSPVCAETNGKEVHVATVDPEPWDHFATSAVRPSR